nr:alpha-galactosidase [Raoultella sp. NCTC 9187]
MNSWAMYALSDIKQVGCAIPYREREELAHDLDLTGGSALPLAGINHMAFYLSLEKKTGDGSYVSIYPDMLQAFAEGRAEAPENSRCRILFAMNVQKAGYFVTESSEHFGIYPWFIKPGREDLIARYQVPLDEYPKRCVEQVANWHKELETYKTSDRIDIKPRGNTPARL